MGHQQSNRVSSVSKCFDGGVTWCGARAQTAAISARASTSRRLRQRLLPRSDAVYTVYHGRHGGRCRCGDSSVTLRGGHVRHFLSVQRSSLRSGSSETRISKVFGQRFASFHQCLLRRQGASLWSRCPRPSAWTRSLLCQANSSPTSCPVAPFAVGSPPPFSRFILHLWA